MIVRGSIKIRVHLLVELARIKNVNIRCLFIWTFFSVWDCGDGIIQLRWVEVCLILFVVKQIVFSRIVLTGFMIA